MKNTPKIAVALLAAGFVGATLAPAAAQSTPAMKGKPAAEKRMAYSAGHHGKRNKRRRQQHQRVNEVRRPPTGLLGAPGF